MSIGLTKPVLITPTPTNVLMFCFDEMKIPLKEKLYHDLLKQKAVSSQSCLVKNQEKPSGDIPGPQSTWHCSAYV